ncbi:DUF5694 domain-containing protein [Flagellimonas lutaonensis]|uniref:Haem-binding uptake Tiki superfamily ChaN domain-containing protein n=1 Tax=Flagellimonas lutaonensis TaxID=516051 RepID=A0A0D5YV76_9FLAO|nr:DUF5694 domain-containing protein [Allomuricauda lutaonensis]AKA36222.1 hypothetical protein VC82_2661 [Allomuricauda lutaonensis]
MKYLRLPLCLCILAVVIAGCTTKTSQNNSSTDQKTAFDTLKGPSDFYPKERVKVLVVGTFHFEYPGLDAHKTSDENKVDVLKEPKKSELEELVAYIKKFKPNKVVIEARPTWNTMEKFEQYKNGGFTDKRDERFTLGMRIAKDLGLDTLYALDAHSLIRDLYEKDSVLVKELTNKIDGEADDAYWELSKKWLDYEDKIRLKLPLLDYFKRMNSRENHRANYGLYLTGNIGNSDGQAADYLSMWWYNRNLRIFAKLVEITDGPKDRILVIFGNGHAALLRHLFEATPQYEFVEFDSL